MQGVQKIKCSSCGTMFMSEDNSVLCPSCREQNNQHKESGYMSGSSCGCGHSH
ncbi:MAG TPA: hypothetical protein VFX18_03580 [Candidatus Nitrosocosmicus sp.]|nr:hypothetical protein [Candidatus Nitrosocosmicus sp.]